VGVSLGKWGPSHKISQHEIHGLRTLESAIGQ
jgi:hypothetical protein